jgi:hypothetical protein
MRNTAAAPNLPIRPRGRRPRAARFTAPAFMAPHFTPPPAANEPRALELLRKSPAWIDRDL